MWVFCTGVYVGQDHGLALVPGTAVTSATDTLVFTSETEAYRATGKDSVVDLAMGWNESEFNIIGGGSDEVFTGRRSR